MKEVLEKIEAKIQQCQLEINKLHSQLANQQTAKNTWIEAKDLIVKALPPEPPK